jgi:hypothetical protein
MKIRIFVALVVISAFIAYRWWGPTNTPHTALVAPSPTLSSGALSSTPKGVVVPPALPVPINVPTPSTLVSIPQQGLSAIYAQVEKFNGIYFSVVPSDTFESKTRALSVLASHECTCPNPLPAPQSNAGLARKKSDLTISVLPLSQVTMKLIFYRSDYVKVQASSTYIGVSHQGTTAQRTVLSGVQPYALWLQATNGKWLIARIELEDTIPSPS